MYRYEVGQADRPAADAGPRSYVFFSPTKVLLVAVHVIRYTYGRQTDAGQTETKDDQNEH